MQYWKIGLWGWMIGMLAGCNPAGNGAKIESRPNILYIMADDHTTQTFGIYKARLDSFARTHHIQRLAREGMRLDNVFCTNSICVPSRASILTGQYSHINNVYTLSDALEPELDNVTKQFQKGGYQTALIGKWHLKKEPSGFDYYNVLPGQGLYYDPRLKEKGVPWEDANKGGKTYAGHSTDVITDISLKWLREKRKADQPFFLMTHFKASHEPFYYAERYKDLYKDEEIPYPESLFEDLSHRSPATRENAMWVKDMRDRHRDKPAFYPDPALDFSGMSEDEQIRAAYQKMVKDYLRCVAGINDNIGRLLDYLDESGLADNTVVIYTSDQGYFLGEHGYIDKRWMYEESARMPFVIRYPGQVKPGTANQDLILNVDFAPTFLEIAGLDIPSSIQGKSFLANITQKTPSDWRTSFYYRYWLQERRPAHYGIRTERYKLIFFYSLPLDRTGTGKASSPGWELYDLEEDPQELHNVYDDPAYAGVIPGLIAKMDAHKEDLGDTNDKYPEVQRLTKSLNIEPMNR